MKKRQRNKCSENQCEHSKQIYPEERKRNTPEPGARWIRNERFFRERETDRESRSTAKFSTFRVSDVDDYRAVLVR